MRVYIEEHTHGRVRKLRKQMRTNGDAEPHSGYSSHSRRFKLPRGQRFYLRNEQKANTPPNRAVRLFFKCQRENPSPSHNVEEDSFDQPASAVAAVIHCFGFAIAAGEQTNATNVPFLNGSQKIIYNFTLFLAHSLGPLVSHAVVEERLSPGVWTGGCTQVCARTPL